MSTRICHISTAHQNTDDRIFEKECRSLAKAGYDVRLVCRGNNDEDRDGVHFVLLDNPHGRFDRMVKLTRDAYKIALSLDTAIYHIHDPELLPVALKLHKRGKKVVFDSHECYPTQILSKAYIPKTARGFISKAYKAYETHVCKAIDAVIFPCRIDGKNPFENRAKETVFIDNVPNLADFYDHYNPVERSKSFCQSEIKICYVGGLSADRGIVQLARAAVSADVTLVLAGAFTSETLKNEVLHIGGKNLDYRGVCTRAQVLEIYNECAIGCSTILKTQQYGALENLPTKVYEYMSLGLPVILTDYKYGRKMCDQYKFGVCVDPEDSESIAAAIRMLVDNPDTALEMGANGRRAVLERFNWKTQEQNLLKLYQSLINE